MVKEPRDRRNSVRFIQGDPSRKAIEMTDVSIDELLEPLSLPQFLSR